MLIAAGTVVDNHSPLNTKTRTRVEMSESVPCDSSIMVLNGRKLLGDPNELIEENDGSPATIEVFGFGGAMSAMQRR